jgi:hypothetical protein
MRIPVVALIVIVASASAQFHSFIPSYSSFPSSFSPSNYLTSAPHQHSSISYAHSDPLISSASIASNSYVPSQSLTQRGPAAGSMESLMASVIDEATADFDRSELPVAINHTHISIQPYTGGGGHGGHARMGGHGMGGHNYCKFTPTTQKIGRVSNINIKAYEILTKRYQVSKSQAIAQLSSRLPDFCRKEEMIPISCDRNSRYRSIDGTCNNLQNPYWGASFTVFDRLAPALYEDGWNEPRGAGKKLQGSRLPNARIVSLSVHPDYVQPDNRMTNMVPQFGQFLVSTYLKIYFY